MRERSSQDEPALKKQLILSQPSKEEEEEEREEEEREEEGREEEARSDSDDTADNPRYLQDPREIAADDNEDDDDDDGDDGGDVEEDPGDTDWFGQSEG
ncbi:hypothetical protein RHMOL_Rhmol01G0201500 [Rhododendron molle]|uniref:Uncharacterized protein n=1 Tax=Rhododendron molle TaxID=49168 RepID=A0ACC0Q3R4_RHOML|nr:hypothetical protein RHMOL_Rhmol01G0201500 [Rhododendron molle]